MEDMKPLDGWHDHADYVNISNGVTYGVLLCFQLLSVVCVCVSLSYFYLFIIIIFEAIFVIHCKTDLPPLCHRVSSNPCLCTLRLRRFKGYFFSIVDACCRKKRCCGHLTPVQRSLFSLWIHLHIYLFLCS